VLPSIDNLRCFLAAARHLNFRRAAVDVALTPAAFGQRIRQLEDQLGDRLFERTTRSVALTDAGHALLPAARDTVAAASRCADVVRGEATSHPDLLIGTRFELGLSWITPVVAELHSTHPSWRVELYFGSGPDIIDQLIRGTVDAVVTSAPIARTDLVHEVLHPEHYVLVGAPALLDKRPLRHPTDAAVHVLLDVDPTLPLARYLTSVAPPMPFADVRTCGTGGAVRQLALAGVGVAVLPTYMVRDDLDAGHLVRLLPSIEPLSDTFRLIWRASAGDRRGFHELAQVLRDRPLR
jgi:DNA-binding transcriptional LysR family regulator